MGEWKPLYISLLMLIVLGVILPYVVGSVVEINPDNVESTLISGLIDLVENGVTIFTFSINPFDVLGETIKDTLINYIAIYDYIPLVLLIPIITFITLGVLYSTIKLLPTT